jgi:hypothetical protein
VPPFRLDTARQQFQDRLLTQFRSRYPGWEFAPRDDGFGILARRQNAQVAMSLESLFAESNRAAASVPEQISHFVAAAGPRLSAAEQSRGPGGPAPDPGALVWCVRTERSIRSFSRFAELATRELPGGLLAFVAEVLPGDAMRGVSQAEAAAGGLSGVDLVQHADHNTPLRLERWRRVLENPSESRWLFTDDILFSSSLLMVPEFLETLAQRGEGEAALVAPDRAMLVAAVGEAAAPEQLLPIAHRLYRLARTPLSPVLLSTDGRTLALHPAEVRPERQRAGWRRLLGARSN